MQRSEHRGYSGPHSLSYAGEEFAQTRSRSSRQYSNSLIRDCRKDSENLHASGFMEMAVASRGLTAGCRFPLRAGKLSFKRSELTASAPFPTVVRSGVPSANQAIFRTPSVRGFSVRASTDGDGSKPFAITTPLYYVNAGTSEFPALVAFPSPPCHPSLHLALPPPLSALSLFSLPSNPSSPRGSSPPPPASEARALFNTAAATGMAVLRSFLLPLPSQLLIWAVPTPPLLLMHFQGFR